MYKFNCLLLCFAWLIVGSFASVVPFIDPCEEQDTACLIKSSQKAVPYFAEGGFLGLRPLDPMNIDKTVSVNEGGVNIEFRDIIISGTKNCKVTGVEVSTPNKYLTFASNCPIHVKGKYTASGKLLGVDIEGDGPFTVDADEIHMTVKVVLNIVTGPDGEEHWQISKPEHSFELKENAKVVFQNLFNGDEAKAGPVQKVIDQHPKELMATFGQGIVKEVIDHVLENIEVVVAEATRSQLQKL